MIGQSPTRREAQAQFVERTGCGSDADVLPAPHVRKTVCRYHLHSSWGI